MVIATVPDEGRESISTAYMPNFCSGHRQHNGVYTIGYSDNGCTESWFAKTYAEQSWYNAHFCYVLNLWLL